MSTTKSGGRARQGTPRKGRRLGIKLFAGEIIKSGQIVVRQIGSSFHPGQGTAMGRDFTLFSKIAGKVNFKIKNGKRFVEVK